MHSKTSGNSLTKSGLIWELHSFKVFWIQSRSSSLCVDGHFFRRRPQLSRFPVCRCRVRARARSAPAARLSVPMAAAALRGPGSDGAAEGRAGRRLPGRARCPRPERRARGCRLRAATARCALGPEEAGRRRRGGPGGWRWRGRPLRLLRPPLQPPPPKGESCFLEDND